MVDLYGADVLQRIGGGTGLPAPGPDFPALKVLITPGGKRLYARQGRMACADATAASAFATSRKRLAGDRAIVMCRDSMLRDFEAGGLRFTAGHAYAFSSWSGYLDPADLESGWARATAAARPRRTCTPPVAPAPPTSRVSPPRSLVPVHGLSW